MNKAGFHFSDGDRLFCFAACGQQADKEGKPFSRPLLSVAQAATTPRKSKPCFKVFFAPLRLE
jgi:hypothetical protein